MNKSKNKLSKVVNCSLALSLVGTGVGLTSLVVPKHTVLAAKNHDGVCQVETKTGELKFNAKSTTELSYKPLDLLLVMDGSGSINDTKAKMMFEIYASLLKTLPEDTKVSIAIYGTNRATSYESEGPAYDAGPMTVAEALGLIQPLADNFAPLPQDLVRAIGASGKGNGGNHRPYETWFASNLRPDAVHSVLQITDEWIDYEEIDVSFAAWAKANAKTFMSVIMYPNNNTTSYRQMTNAGHPNIYVTGGKDIGTITQEVNSQFTRTATEKVTKPKTTINVVPEQGLTLKEVKLVSPDGKEEVLPIQGNKVNVVKDLPKDGDWTVKVKADGLVHENRKVVTTVNVGGKEVGKNEILFEGCNDDVKGKDEERTKVNIDFKTNYIEDKDLPFGTEKVIKDGVIGIKEIIKTWNTVNGKRVGEPKIVENMLQGVIDKVIARGIQKPKDFTYRVLDKDGKVLVDTTKVSQGYVGNAYKLAEVPKLEGYDVETPEGVKLEGVFKGENVNIDFVAYKLGKGVTLKTVTKDGKDLQAEQVLVEDNKRVGTEYTGKVAYEIKDKGRLYRLVALEQDSKPVDNKPADNKPVENKPVENKPVEGNPVEGNPVDGKPVDNKTVDSKFDKDVDLKGSVSDVKIEYKAIYEEVKVGDVKVEFVDDTGKVLKSPVLLNTKDSLLGTDYKYDKDARLTVGSDTYALVKTTLEDKEVKDIKGKFDEKAKTYKLVYKKVVKPEPKKLPKTSGDNSGSLGLISTIVGLGVLLLGFVRKLVLK